MEKINSKKPKIKNRTSSMTADRSVMLIERCLVDIGASHIAKSYDTFGNLSGVMFQINQNGNPFSFQMPANVDAITNKMLEKIKRPRRNTEKLVREQALRTAWKLLLDWVEVQASMIIIGRREVIEVFLPYIYNFQKQETFYQRLQNSQFKMLQAGN